MYTYRHRLGDDALQIQRTGHLIRLGDEELHLATVAGLLRGTQKKAMKKGHGDVSDARTKPRPLQVRAGGKNCDKTTTYVQSLDHVHGARTQRLAHGVHEDKDEVHVLGQPQDDAETTRGTPSHHRLDFT